MKLLALALLLSASSASANVVDAEAYYLDIAGEGFGVQYSSEGSPLLGVNITEKSRGDTVCQKATVLAPGAESLFRCYQQALTGSTAKGTYEALEGAELSVSYRVGSAPLVGATTKQKNSARGFCRATGAVIPRPVYSYACYVQIL
jgi:hypothetical protein